jgi:DNA-binding transcriptional LysR family regulator
VDPAQVQLLALIERHGSLAAAALALQRTPAAITQQLARAERDCGTVLVRRGPRGATLTAAGALLAAHGRVVDEATAAAATELAALLGQLAKRLRIGAFQAAARHLLPPALTALRHRHPDADLSVIDLRSQDGVAEVAAGRLDIAVVATWDAPEPQLADPVVHPLLRDPMVLVLPDDHPLAAGAGPVRLEQLRDDAWVTILAGHAARAQFDRAAAAAGFTPRIRFQTESYDVAQALVGTGFGVALISRLALTPVPGTVVRALAPPALSRRLWAVTAADSSATPLVATTVALLHDVAVDLAAG